MALNLMDNVRECEKKFCNENDTEMMIELFKIIKEEKDYGDLLGRKYQDHQEGGRDWTVIDVRGKSVEIANYDENTGAIRIRTMFPGGKRRLYPEIGALLQQIPQKTAWVQETPEKIFDKTNSQHEVYLEKLNTARNQREN